MNETTLIMAFYYNYGMLKEQYTRISKLPGPIKKALKKIIVVDDGTKEYKARAFYPKDDIGVEVEVYRFNQDIRWNQDACRNLGVDKSTTPWLLLTDIDHIVTPDAWWRVLYGKCDPSCVYRFSRVSAPELLPYKPHPNSWFMHRDIYKLTGGYDERFAGYYGTDADFRDRLVNAARIIMLGETLIRVPREVIPDASTQPSFGRKSAGDGQAIGRLKEERNKLPKEKQRPMRKNFPYTMVPRTDRG
jgi:glycosyltransferase involved in cell wall biosynthesis